MTIQAILAAMLAAGAPIVGESLQKDPTQLEQTQTSQWILGKEKISQIRAAYERGEYNDFLKSLDDSYREVHAQDGLGSLARMRSSDPSELKDWENQAYLIQEERNNELLQAVQNDDSIFAKKVHSVVASRSASEKAALSELSQYNYMQPESGRNSDENALIDLDLEYEYKAIHLDTPLKTDLSSMHKREFHIVLQMEKMDKMKKLSESFKDVSLKEKIALVAGNLDERLAQHWDATDLNALAKNQIKPTTSTEEAVASVLSAKHAKFNELFKQYLDAR